MMKYKPGEGKEAYSFNLANSTYPKQLGWKKFWTDLCSMVSTKCAHPAYGLQWMFEIEHAKSVQELRDNRKLDGLSSKLRLCLMGFLKGQIVREIQLADARLKLSEGSELNGRQIAWMMRERFRLDEDEGHFYDERELMDLQLDKDNVPAYLVAWDDLSLHIDLDPKVQEICFSRQIERSTQLEKVFREYQTDCVRNNAKYRTYKCLRNRVDTHLGIALVLANRKKQHNQAAGAMGLVANGKGSHA